MDGRRGVRGRGGVATPQCMSGGGDRPHNGVPPREEGYTPMTSVLRSTRRTQRSPMCKEIVPPSLHVSVRCVPGPPPTTPEGLAGYNSTFGNCRPNGRRPPQRLPRGCRRRCSDVLGNQALGWWGSRTDTTPAGARRGHGVSISSLKERGEGTNIRKITREYI